MQTVANAVIKRIQGSREIDNPKVKSIFSYWFPGGILAALTLYAITPTMYAEMSCKMAGIVGFHNTLYGWLWGYLVMQEDFKLGLLASLSYLGHLLLIASFFAHKNKTVLSIFTYISATVLSANIILVVYSIMYLSTLAALGFASWTLAILLLTIRSAYLLQLKEFNKNTIICSVTDNKQSV